MNGNPRSPRVRFIAQVLEEVVVLLPTPQQELDQAVAELVVEASTFDSQPEVIAVAWDRVVAALTRLDGGCAGGPLLALVFNEMIDLSYINRGPINLCLALALEQALPLLPRHERLREAIEVLAEQTDKTQPDELDMCIARVNASDALEDMVSRRIGGVVAVLMLEWLRNRSF